MIAKSAYDSFSSFSNCLTLDLLYFFTLVKWAFYDELFMFENDRDIDRGLFPI